MSSWQDDMENSERWPELFYGCGGPVPGHERYDIGCIRLARARQGRSKRGVTGAKKLFSRPQQPKPSEPTPEDFAPARQLSGHPVAVHLQEEKSG